ncbi:MAG: Cna B-type domain-containing protein [Anaerolineaceae bacterium]|nr:Cna B-type domain-containing protein [Anaerolineaceae bacterium]
MKKNILRSNNIFVVFVMLFGMVWFSNGTDISVVYAKDIYDIVVYKEWDDNFNLNKRPDKLTVTLKNSAENSTQLNVDDNWYPKVISDVPLEMNSDGTVVKYVISETSSDDRIEQYSPSVDYEESWDYTYSSNTSAVNPDQVENNLIDTVVQSSSPIKISQSVETGKISAPTAYLNYYFNLNYASITEYDGNGNIIGPVTGSITGNHEFEINQLVSENTDPSENKYDFGISWVPRVALYKNAEIGTDHYFTIRFRDMVTVKNGTQEETHDAIFEYSNIRAKVYNADRSSTSSNPNGKQQLLMVFGNQGLINGYIFHKDRNENNRWAYDLGRASYDVTITVPDYPNCDLLLGFYDIDVYCPINTISNYTEEIDTIYLKRNFYGIYTRNLKSLNDSEKYLDYVKFIIENGIFKGQAHVYNTNDTVPFSLDSTFFARAHIDEEGFIYSALIGPGTTTIPIRPNRLKVTVDGLYTDYVGGTIVEIQNNQNVDAVQENTWRNYGEDKLLKAIPNENYHIASIQIDGYNVDLNAFDAEGVQSTPELGFGWYGNTGVESISLYQRENGEIDIYLPKHFLALHGEAPFYYCDHWIDVSFEPNVSVAYKLTNILETKTVIGSKTWIDGKISHNNASDVTLTLIQTNTVTGEQVTMPNIPSWNGNIYQFSDLPKYDDEGNEYTYDVTETIHLSDYTGTKSGLNFTNTRTGKITITGTKTWIDGNKPHRNNRDVTLLLQRTSAKNPYLYEVVYVTPSWSDNTYTFSNLDKYDPEGYLYTYLVSEIGVHDGYKSTVDETGLNFTNEQKPDKVRIAGSKIWVDGGKVHNNATDIALTLKQRSARPGAGEYTVDKTPLWIGNAYIYDDLDRYDIDGYEYTYTVSETCPAGYSCTTDQSGFNFTNTLLQQTTEISGEKTWIDGNLAHRNANEITLVLQRTSTKSNSAPEIVNVTPSWNGSVYTFRNLDKYDNDRYEYKYTVTETVIPEGYVGSVDITGLNFINELAPEKVRVAGTKTWVDGGKSHDNAHDITLTLERQSAKPGSVKSKVYQSPSLVGNVYIYEGLDRRDAEGYEYTYTVSEHCNLNGYETTVDSTGFNFTNTIKQETIEIRGTKTWVDGGLSHNNASDITLTLQRVGSENPFNYEFVSSSPSWVGNEYVFANLPKYDSKGYEYGYIVTETGVPKGYNSEVDPSGLNFTNTLEPETVTISGTKTWIDGGKVHNNAEEVELTLFQSMTSNPNSGAFIAPMDVTPTWVGNAYSFSDLPKYDIRGYEYDYTVQENSIPGYILTVDSTGLHFTNTIVQEYITVEGTKTWVDGEKPHNNAQELTLTLQRTSAKNGFTEIVTDAVPVWDNNRYSFTNLPRYDTEGYEYSYNVVETAMPAGYTVTVDVTGLNFTNTETPNYLTKGGTKIWLDGGKTHDNARNITLTLTRTSAKSGSTPETVNQDPVWYGNAFVYYDLPESDPEGFKYEYSISEQVNLDGYTSSFNPATWTFTNTIKQETIEIRGTKTWVDGGLSHDNASDITLTLQRVSSENPFHYEIVSSSPSWSGNEYVFANLPKYDSKGYEYGYIVTETEVPEGYTSEVDASGLNFTNTFDQDHVTIGGTKIWIDGGRRHNNADEVRLTLRRKSAKQGSVEETVSVNPVWQGNAYLYPDLPRYDTERYEYTYSVSEQTISDEYEMSASGYNFINRLKPVEIEISGTKTWVDGGLPHDNASEITLTLQRTSAKNGYNTETVSVNPTWVNNVYKFSGLPKYDSEGNEYRYSVVETGVPKGYSSEVDPSGLNFTNTLTGKVTIGGSKTWLDGLRKHVNEDEVILTLTRRSIKDGAPVETVDVKPLWIGNAYIYADMDQYDSEGFEYTYFVTEQTLSNEYETQVSGYNFINRLKPVEIEISGTKTWIDGGLEHNNETEVPLALMRTSAKNDFNTEIVADVRPAWSGDTYVFNGLPKYDDEGFEYRYSVSETGYLKDYTVSVDPSGLHFTNRLDQDHVTIGGTKTWIDGGKSHVNASDVSLTLTRTIDKPGSVSEVVSVNPVWAGNAFIYTHLPKYDDARNEYTYKVAESTVPTGYSVDSDSTNWHFVNILNQEYIDISGTKTWVDGDQPHNNNAAEVTLTLMRTSSKNGLIREIVNDVQPAWNGNSYVFAHLPKYDAERYEYKYEVIETGILSGFTVTSGATEFDFVNTRTPDIVTITGTKTWVDGGILHNNMADLILTLRQTSKKPGSQTVDLPNVPSWNGNIYVFSNLPKYDAERYEYEYDVVETVLLSGYTPVKDGVNFINTKGFKVTHQFVSATPGKELPEEVIELTPADQTGLVTGDVVTPSDFPVKTVTVADGTWKFFMWYDAQKTITNRDETFTGAWLFEMKAPEKKVSENSAAGMNNAPVYVGDRITYEIHYINYLDRQTNITITDLLPDNLKFISADNSGAYSDRMVMWMLRNVPAGYQGTVSVTVEVIEGDFDYINNNAYVDVPGMDRISVDPPINPLRFKVTHEFVSGTPNKSLPHSVLNHLPEDQLGKVSNETVYPSEFTPAEIPVEDGVWKFVRWDADSKTITTKNEHFVGTWEFEPQPVTKHVTADSAAGVDGAPVYIGDLVTYQINYKNWLEGKTNIYIQDELPDQVRYISSEPTGILENHDKVIRWELRNVGPEQSGKVTVTVKVNDKTVGDLINRAHVTSDGFETQDPVPPVNHIVYSVKHQFRSITEDKFLPQSVLDLLPEDQLLKENGETVYPSELEAYSIVTETGTWVFDSWDYESKVIDMTDELFIGSWKFVPFPPMKVINESKLTGDQIAYIGDWITWQISYTNWLDITADVTVTDQLPEGAEFVEASNGGQNENGTVTWLFKDLPSGQKGTVTLKINVVPGMSDPIRNQAIVNVGRHEPEPTDPVETPLRFRVFHEFESETADKVLPQQILDRVPDTQIGKRDGETVVPGFFDRSDFSTDTGKWVFVDWDQPNRTINKDDVVFKGIWKFVPNPPEKRIIEKSVSDEEGQTAYIGDLLTYQIAYTNWLDITADVLITDRLPEFAAFVEADNNGQFDNGTVTWLLRDVPSGTKDTVSVQIRIMPGMTDPIENRGLVHVGNHEPQQTNLADIPLRYRVIHKFVSGTENKVISQQILDLLPADQTGKQSGNEVTPTDFEPKTVSDETGTWVFYAWDEEQKIIGTDDAVFFGTWKYIQKPPVKLVADSSSAGKGGAMVDMDDEITYQIDFANWMDKTADVTIADRMPAGTTFIEASNGGQENGGIVTWILRGLSPRSSGTVSFRVRITEGVTHNLENQADVRVDGHEPELTNLVMNPIREYTVRHEFSGADLPEEVLKRLPADQTGKFNHETVWPSEFDSSPVYVRGGKWAFRGWDSPYKIIEGADVIFTGTWIFIPNNQPPVFFPIQPEPCLLPNTGFSSNVSGQLPQPLSVEAYDETGMRLSIPALNVEIDLVRLAKSGESWPVDQLADRGGILEGFADPGQGYSIIAAHNTLSATEIGPFAKLPEMAVNDLIVVSDERGNVKHFYVYTNKLVEPDGFDEIAAVAENEPGSLILVTCENEAVTGGYLNRRVVFAKPMN